MVRAISILLLNLHANLTTISDVWPNSGHTLEQKKISLVHNLFLRKNCTHFAQEITNNINIFLQLHDFVHFVL